MAQVLPEPLKKAWTAFQTGELTGAAGLCQDILARHNRNVSLYFDAVHLLAAVQLRSGRLAEALASYDEAIAIKPRFPDALNNRANTLKALNRFDGYDSALAVRSDFVEALNNRGPEILTFGEAPRDFSEAAGLLSCLDLLIRSIPPWPISPAPSAYRSGSCCSTRPIGAGSSIVKTVPDIRQRACSGSAGTTIGMRLWHASPSNCKDRWAVGRKRRPRRPDSGVLGMSGKRLNRKDSVAMRTSIPDHYCGLSRG